MRCLAMASAKRSCASCAKALWRSDIYDAKVISLLIDVLKKRTVERAERNLNRKGGTSRLGASWTSGGTFLYFD